MSTTVLPSIQAYLNGYSAIAIVFFGTIGNALVLILFGQRRRNSCAMCLLCASIFSALNIIVNLPVKVAGPNFSDPANYNLGICKLRFYTGQAWTQITRYMIALACFDRYILTTNNVRLKLITRPKTMRRIIGMIVLFWHLFSIHLLIFSVIEGGRCGQFGLYNLFYLVYYVILVCLVPAVLITVLGLKAYWNVRKLHARIQPMAGGSNNHLIHRQDRELLSMVLAESIVYLLVNFPYVIIYLENVITNYMDVNKSLLYIQIESFAFAVGVALLYVNNAAPFYTYFFASRAFRKDVKRLLSKWKHHVQDRLTFSDNSQERPGQT